MTVPVVRLSARALNRTLLSIACSSNTFLQAVCTDVKLFYSNKLISMRTHAGHMQLILWNNQAKWVLEIFIPCS